MTDLPVEAAWLESVLADLVAIDSRNPSLVDGAPGEGRIADYVAETMRSMGLEVIRHESEPGRPSVVGRLPGRGTGPCLMLNAHMDTVGVDMMAAPFGPRVEDRLLYGRGAYDMKGSLAACLAAARAVVRSETQLAGDLLVAAVADEEHSSMGTAEVLARHQIDGAIVTEPTELGLCVAHKGFVWIAVETIGRAAHGSRFEEGIDANLRMGRFLARLADLESELRRRRPHPLVGPPSLHAATVAGGSGLSSYADRCQLEIERRTVPGETVTGVEAEIEGILKELRNEDPSLEIGSRVIFARQPFEARTDSPLVALVEEAAEAALGRLPPHVGATCWMDAALCAEAGIDTVVIGPAGHGAHAAIEWVDLDSCAALADVLARSAIGWCGRAERAGG